MAKSPFYSIKINDEDITSLISSFDYEDCTEEDDILTLVIEGLDKEDIDEDKFKIGYIITFFFGFIDGKKSTKRKAQIIESEEDYEDGKINVTVKARDLGFVAKKLTISKVYKDKKASDIVEDIANILGLNKEIEKSQTTYKEYCTAGKTINHILKELSTKEGSKKDDSKGDWQSYVRGDTLYFKPKDFKKKSERTFTYKDGDGTLKGLSVKYEDNDSGGSSSVKSSGVDIETGKKYTVEAKPDEHKQTNTGEKRLDFDVNANLKKSDVGVTGKNMNVSSLNKEDSEKKIVGYQKEKGSSIVNMVLEIELDPTINSGDIITVSNVAKKHEGNWVIKKARHTIRDTAETTLSCYRNGGKKEVTKTGGANTGATNKSQGEKEGQTKREIRTFDENSKRII